MASKNVQKIDSTPQSSHKETVLFVINFVVMYLVNILVVYVAHLVFPNHVVLGNDQVTRNWSLVLAGLTFTTAITFLIPFIQRYEFMRGKLFSMNEWMALYAVINAGALWLVTRFAEQLGWGVSSWVVVVILALLLDFLQGMVVMMVQKHSEKLV